MQPTSDLKLPNTLFHAQGGKTAKGRPSQRRYSKTGCERKSRFRNFDMKALICHRYDHAISGLQSPFIRKIGELVLESRPVTRKLFELGCDHFTCGTASTAGSRHSSSRSSMEIGVLQLVPTGRCSASALYPFNTPRIMAA